jgi:hypothetical protein
MVHLLGMWLNNKKSVLDRYLRKMAKKKAGKKAEPVVSDVPPKKPVIIDRDAMQQYVAWAHVKGIAEDCVQLDNAMLLFLRSLSGPDCYVAGLFMGMFLAEKADRLNAPTE